MERKFKNIEECYEYAIRQNKLIRDGVLTPKRYSIDEFESHLIDAIRRSYITK